MAYVWRERKLIYFAAPGTGSTAFLHYLQKKKVGEFVPKDDIAIDGKLAVNKKHSTIANMRRHGCWEDVFDGYAKAVGVRNPFAWYVAYYIRLRTKRLREIEDPRSFINKMPEKERARLIDAIKTSAKQTFEEYLRGTVEKDTPFELQGHFHDGIDFFIHQERLAADAAKLFERIGAPQKDSVQEYGLTDDTLDLEKYKTYYTPELTELVYRMNGPFFDRFPEYSFEGLATETA